MKEKRIHNALNDDRVFDLCMEVLLQIPADDQQALVAKLWGFGPGDWNEVYKSAEGWIVLLNTDELRSYPEADAKGIIAHELAHASLESVVTIEVDEAGRKKITGIDKNECEADALAEKWGFTLPYSEWHEASKLITSIEDVDGLPNEWDDEQ